jgi:hypothetical protein
LLIVDWRLLIAHGHVQSTIKNRQSTTIHQSTISNPQRLEGSRPQTERLHIVERYRRIDVGRMSVEITIDDPGAYTRPWKVRRLLQLAPGEEIQEYLCNENHKTEHFVGN